MCQGTTKKGKKCKKAGEPFCHLHGPKLTVAERKIEKKKARGPSKSDGPGFIYIYMLDNDPDHFYKIGRTTRTVEKRLKEWKGSRLVRSFPVKHNKHAERLIHLHLDAKRIYRYKTPEGYCNIWKSNGDPVLTRDAELKEKYKLSASGKEIEWFICYLDEVVDLITREGLTE